MYFQDLVITNVNLQSPITVDLSMSFTLGFWIKPIVGALSTVISLCGPSYAILRCQQGANSLIYLFNLGA